MRREEEDEGRMERKMNGGRPTHSDCNVHTVEKVSKILKTAAFASPPSWRSCNLSSGNLIIPNFGSWKNRDVPQQIRTYLIKPEASLLLTKKKESFFRSFSR